MSSTEQGHSDDNHSNVRPERLTVTVEEAAQMLGIGRSLGYELVRRGEIRSIKLGRRVLIPRQVLAALLSGEGGVE